MSATVGLVVLNWNGGQQTVACIESLMRQEYRDRFIVLVDNGSRPEERAELLRRYGETEDVECLFLDENAGYAGGNNAGMDEALARGAEIVGVVTQDVTLEPGALSTLVDALSAGGVGIAGPRVMDLKQPTRVLSLGERLHPALFCVPRTWLRYRFERSAPYEVGGVLGCAVMLNRRCLQAVRGFDAGFFAYYEEVDLCLRARRHGFRIVCAPQAVAYHDGMRGFAGGFTALSAELKARNLIRLIRLWARPLDYLVLIPTYLLLLLASMAVYVCRARGDVLAALARGVVAGLQGREGRPQSNGLPVV